MKKWFRSIEIGVVLSFSTLALCLTYMSINTRIQSVRLAFPAFWHYVLQSKVELPTIFAITAALFVWYGIAGGSIYYVCKLERLSLPWQCVTSWFLAYSALFATAWACDKFEYSWWLMVGSIISFVLVWLLRVWRWKSRIAEIGLTLPQSTMRGKRRIWNTAVSQFAATAFLWMIAAGYGAVILLLLCIK